MHWTPDIFQKALSFAARQHHGQSYGGPQEGERIPYINHVVSVAMEIIWALQQEPSADSALAVQCALLHDTIEDTDTDDDQILALFGRAVADGVQALSKNPNLPTKAEQMADSLQRIRTQPREIWMVKMADRITNLYHPPFYWKNEKILAYRDEAIHIYDELHSAHAPLAERLKQKIDGYPSFLRQ